MGGGFSYQEHAIVDARHKGEERHGPDEENDEEKEPRIWVELFPLIGGERNIYQ